MRLLVASGIGPEHPSLALPAFAALRESIPGIRGAIDDVLRREHRRSLN